jgi:NADPH-dependent curcumin reductase CurA
MLARMSENRQLVLARRPTGTVQDDDFELRTSELPVPGEGEVLVKVCWLSFEPAQRGWMNDVPSYIPPVKLGDPMRSWGVGEVVESGDDHFAIGELVSGPLNWQEHALMDAKALSKVPPGVAPTAALGVFGTTGLTAYFGMLEVGRPKPGDVVLVSGAAGATGSVAGQIAKLKGAATVIGIAGGPEKCEWVVDVAGFDACIDYKSEHVQSRIAELAPKGVNVYFDNVGGEILDAALINLAKFGTAVTCGGISTGYTIDAKPPAIHNTWVTTVRSARIEGFIVLNYMDRFGEAVKQLATWAQEGNLAWAEDVQHGPLTDAPATLRRLFEGKNLGKQLLQIAETTPAP